MDLTSVLWARRHLEIVSFVRESRGFEAQTGGAMEGF